MHNIIRTALHVDFDKPASQQKNLHNRWHPEIPCCAKIQDGEVVKIECLDYTGGQIGNNDSIDDIADLDWDCVHYLSGPFNIENAEPGDVLVVEIQDIQPFAERPWGFTGVNGKCGLLAQKYNKPAKAIWDFEGIYCSSRHIPHVRFPGMIHPGLLGCAPSHEILARWNSREAALVNEPGYGGCCPAALPPTSNLLNAGRASAEVRKMIEKEGARTIPGRPENGGNCDIKDLCKGSKVYLPVYLDGAHFSVGDLHFSQGDGEITFCGAIEMAGIITLKFDVMKDGMRKLGMRSPIYHKGPGGLQISPDRYLTFEGFSVDLDKNKQYNLDANVAMQQASLRAIEYLKRFGYSDYQAYLLLSSAPVQGIIAGIVDTPNACVTLGIPMDIFDFDITPEAGCQAMDMAKCVM